MNASISWQDEQNSLLLETSPTVRKLCQANAPATTPVKSRNPIPKRVLGRVKNAPMRANMPRLGLFVPRSSGCAMFYLVARHADTRNRHSNAKFRFHLMFT